MRALQIWHKFFEKEQDHTLDRAIQSLPKGEHLARIAVYDNLATSPRVIDLGAPNVRAFLDLLSTKTYQLAQERGGRVPYVVIKEIIENLIHAFFKGAVISILDGGNTIRITDQGPGIRDKEKAFEPGFSTANDEMKSIIRGVGSGLPIAREALAFSGGTVTIEDNLECGTVITLRLVPSSPAVKKTSDKRGDRAESVLLTARQKKVLLLVTELGSSGPSEIARELKIGLSTAHRDLLAIEQEGLVFSDEHGKRSLTESGMDKLKSILDS